MNRRMNRGQEHCNVNRAGLVLLTLAAMCAAAIPTAARADSIVLQRSVRLRHDDARITLADIARLEGDEAQRLADVVIAERDGAGALMHLSLDDVRAALDAAGAHWGKVHLNGGEVVVRPMRTEAGGGTPLAMQPLAIDESPIDRRKRGGADHSIAELDFTAELASSMMNQPTLRGLIASMAQRQYGLPGERVRLRFDDADSETLDASSGEYRFEVQPRTSFTSGEVGVKVVAWRDGRAAWERSIRFTPRVLIESATAARDIQRGEMVMDADVAATPTWLSPLDATLIAQRIDAIGRIACQSIQTGEVIRRQSIARQTIVERGDLVTVRCLVGGIVITQRAVARGDGTEGDSIELRREGERTSFMATVTGPGEAIVDLARR